MEVICLDDKAYKGLIATLISQFEDKVKEISRPIWVGQEEAMKVLGVKSKTTLQKLRDENKIIYSQHQPKSIMYNYNSLLKYLADNSNVNL